MGNLLKLILLKNMETLSGLRKLVQELSRKIGAPKHSIPTFGKSEHSGLPHIEINGLEYHFVVCERGSEHSRKTTIDKNRIVILDF